MLEDEKKTRKCSIRYNRRDHFDDDMARCAAELSAMIDNSGISHSEILDKMGKVIPGKEKTKPFVYIKNFYKQGKITMANALGLARVCGYEIEFRKIAK
jgi:hypothetical protein